MTRNNLSDADLIEILRPLTGGLSFARPQLQGHYDTWIGARNLSNGPACFAHAMVSVERQSDLHPARDTDALCLALTRLRDPQTITDFFASAVAAGLFDGGTRKQDQVQHRLSLMRELADLFPDLEKGGVLQRANTESLVHESAFWTDPGNLLPGIILARRRLCRIETVDLQGRPVTGSGFLIGPSTILTNFHVVRDVWENQLGVEYLKIRFDYSATTGLEDDESSIYCPTGNWMIARSDTGPWETSDDYWWDNFPKRLAWLGAVGDHLDYAAIRVDGAPGLQRGWYALDQLKKTAPDGVWILHHPSTEKHTITGGKVVYQNPENSRIFHLASTAHGSSGGLVLDQNSAPVGLHYLGAEATNAPVGAGQVHQVINVAISLFQIAEDLKSKGLLSELSKVPGIRPSRGCLDGNYPLFGRTDFIEKLQRIWEGERNVLRVSVEAHDPPVKRPGKSYSVKIIKHLFKAPEHHHIVFRAGDIKVDAHRVACDALKTFVKKPETFLPAAPDTTTPAYVKKLVSKFVQQLDERLKGKVVWIMLDDLDKHDLSDASGREFLSTLYDQISRAPDLRLILIGLPRDVEISGLKEQNVLYSSIAASDLQNPGKIFSEWLKERGARETALDDTSLAFVESIVRSLAGTKAPLDKMSKFVRSHVTAAADDLFGKLQQEQADEE